MNLCSFKFIGVCLSKHLGVYHMEERLCLGKPRHVVTLGTRFLQRGFIYIAVQTNLPCLGKTPCLPQSS